MKHPSYLPLTQPFPGYQDDVVFASILTLNYKWPTVPFGNSVKHLISRLLGYNPENRLGFNGAEEVANHPWFSHVDWVKMKSKTYQVRFFSYMLRQLGLTVT